MLSFALLPLLLHAPAPSQEDPRAEPPRQFQCIVAVSLDRNFEARWYHTASNEGIGISTTDKVVRGQHFGIYPMYLGYAQDEQGRARIEYDVRVLKPDGEPHFAQADLPGYAGSAGDGGSVRLSKALLVAALEPKDALGTYTIEVTAKDRVVDATSKVTRTIELVEYEEGPAFEDDAQLTRWYSEYFDKPRPDRAIPALLAFAAHGWDSEKPTDPRGFLREVFEANHWLFPELLPRFEQLDAEARRATLWLLDRSSYKADEFLKRLAGADRETWDGIRAAHRDPMEEPISGRLDMNELWGMHLISRRYAVLERLCWALAPDETGVVEDGTIHDAEDDTEIPLRLLVAKVAADSLAKTAKWDPVTRSYLQWVQRQETTPKGVRERLAEVLGG